MLAARSLRLPRQTGGLRSPGRGPGHSGAARVAPTALDGGPKPGAPARLAHRGDRKSTRLNSSHSQISYAVFCLKKKKKKIIAESSHKMFELLIMAAGPCIPTTYADV